GARRRRGPRTENPGSTRGRESAALGRFAPPALKLRACASPTQRSITDALGGASTPIVRRATSPFERNGPIRAQPPRQRRVWVFRGDMATRERNRRPSDGRGGRDRAEGRRDRGPPAPRRPPSPLGRPRPTPPGPPA